MNTAQQTKETKMSYYQQAEDVMDAALSALTESIDATMDATSDAFKYTTALYDRAWEQAYKTERAVADMLTLQYAAEAQGLTAYAQAMCQPAFDKLMKEKDAAFAKAAAIENAVKEFRKAIIAIEGI